MYGKLCRRNQIHPTLTSFKADIKILYETEKFVSVKAGMGTMDSFYMKWALCSGSIPLWKCYIVYLCYQFISELYRCNIIETVH